MSEQIGGVFAPKRARVLTPAALCLSVCVLAPVGVLGGCGDALEGDRPGEVRVQRVITRSGERVVSYTAMYDDGVETYVDLQPQGSVDLITVEREGGPVRRLVREGADVELPADGPEAEPIDAAWERRFGAIDALVAVDRVPWSDAHGGLTPAELRVDRPAGDPGS